jgi:hypothetical protein
MPFINLPAPTPLSGPLRLLFGSGAIPTNRFEGTPSILEFFQMVKDYGLSTKNRFFVTFDVPILKNASQYGRRLSMLCKGASFPASKIDTVDLNIIPSMKEKIAMNYNFSEGASLQLSFYCSSAMFERRFFEIWQSAVVNPRNQYVNYYDEYAKPNQISVIKLPRGSAAFEDAPSWLAKKSEKSKPTMKMQGRTADPQTTSKPEGIFYSVTYHECYPTNISTSEVGWSSGSEIMEVTVDIAYKYYRTPVTINFENYEGNVEGPLEGEYLNLLGLMMNLGEVKTGEGLVENKMDKIAKTINGIVLPVTNVANSIRQNF